MNPQDQQVGIYRAGRYRSGSASRSKEVFENPQQLNGEDVLPGFVLSLSIIWEG
jgi:Uma2 family endonuclease